MTKKSDTSSNSGGPAEAKRYAKDLALLGAPPLITGEKKAQYDELLNRLIESVKPKDILELILTREGADLEWDVLRYRRIKADIVNMRLKGLNDYHLALSSCGEDDEDYEDETPADAKRKASTKVVDKEKLNAEIAGIVIANMDYLMRVDQMVTGLEWRRNAAFREIERHRAGLGARLQSAVEKIEDAEYREVGPDELEEQKRAA
jgi:hypothetical protein